ncbi:MAG: RDD family protein, partial [Lentisphaerota bacterium]
RKGSGGRMNMERLNTLTIRTPEGLEFELLPAGPMVRCLAWGIDLAVVMVLETTISTVLGLLALLNRDTAAAFVVLSYFIISIGYGIVTEWQWRGQTIGKRLLRLRVMDEQGLRLKPQQIIIRNLMRFVDSLPAFYLLGGTFMLLNRRSQRLGDFAANTIVVRMPAVEEPDVQQIASGKFNSFRAYPHIEARLRQAVSYQAAILAFRSLLRRDELEDHARLELFRQLAAYFRCLAPFPPEAVDELSDEQYIRNTVDTIFRKPGAEE